MISFITDIIDHPVLVADIRLIFLSGIPQNGNNQIFFAVPCEDQHEWTNYILLGLAHYSKYDKSFHIGCFSSTMSSKSWKL